jgi:hypothetical protein
MSSELVPVLCLKNGSAEGHGQYNFPERELDPTTGMCYEATHCSWTHLKYPFVVRLVLLSLGLLDCVPMTICGAREGYLINGLAKP